MGTATATVVTAVGERTVEVEFNAFGGFYPGSYEQPPEDPEVEIVHVWLDYAGRRRDVLPRLTADQVFDLATGPCLDELRRIDAAGYDDYDEPDYDDVPF